MKGCQRGDQQNRIEKLKWNYLQQNLVAHPVKNPPVQENGGCTS